jgi:hypothetical protein
MNYVYNSHWRRMTPWFKVKIWTEKKYMTPPKNFDLFRMFDTRNIPMGGGMGLPIDTKSEDLVLKYLKKYPHTSHFINLNALTPDSFKISQNHPAFKFVAKQVSFMDQGFSEEKAFSLVEKELGDQLQQEKYERSLFEGLATSNRARSLMTVYEQEAEYESRQKVKQLQRNLPQFKRHQVDLEKKYAELLDENKYTKEEDEHSELKEEGKSYEPVTYRISAVKDRELLHDHIRADFVHRVIIPIFKIIVRKTFRVF